MLTLGQILARLLQAQVLGVLIGLERERRDRPAGLRTHMVVALASATFMVVSIDLIHYQADAKWVGGSYQFDPSRIAAYIVAGMGFLGAGTIFRTESGVSGLTTAGTLWLVAALGMASGAGMFGLAWIAALIALVSLVVLRLVERSIDRFRNHPVARRLSIRVRDVGCRAEVLRVLHAAGARVEAESFDLNGATGRLDLELRIRMRPDADPLSILTPLTTVGDVESVSLHDEAQAARLLN
jgi:putative Mg2+ transporter-C (MgtC) family protein